MDRLKARTGNILDELEKASLKLNLEDKKQQLNNLESEVSNPEIWLNPSVAQEKIKKLVKFEKLSNLKFLAQNLEKTEGKKDE